MNRLWKLLIKGHWSYVFWEVWNGFIENVIEGIFTICEWNYELPLL